MPNRQPLFSPQKVRVKALISASIILTVLVAALRSDDKFSEIGVFMIAATAEAERVQSAIENNADDFLVKPIQAEVLQKKLEAYLKKTKKL